MKRVFYIFILVLMLGGLFTTPVNYSGDEKYLPEEDDEIGEPISNEVDNLDFSTDTHILSAEGDLSSDSITSFSETTDDDVMFYPDTFFNDTRVLASSGVGTPVQYKTYDETHNGTGSLDVFGAGWPDRPGDPSARGQSRKLQHEKAD